MAKEHIEREKAILAVRHAWAKGLEPTQYIEQIPAADVVEVVRCRECKYSYKDEIFGNRWCDSHLGCRKVKDDGYCYLGERKEGANNG